MPIWDGDYSRDMFPSSRRKQYVKGRAQQGVEVADADTNDNTDLVHEKLRVFIEELGGPAFFFQDAFKVVADGSDNDVNILAGSGFVRGNEAYLGLAARYVNLGLAQEDKNLHSVSTGITATTLTDTSQNWVVNELVGRELFPNLTDGTSFTVLSNTATEIVTLGDLSTVATSGDGYYVAMSTPSGGNRTDTLWLNLYLDEISAAEDPYLNHNLGVGIELDRRIKVRTILMVEQGASTYADYVDSDGLQHYLVKLATIQRLDGIDAINALDVTDERDLTISAGGSVTVSGTDGSSGTLDDKIDVQTPLVKSIVNPGGDEELLISLSSPGDPNLYLVGTSPPTWAPLGGTGIDEQYVQARYVGAGQALLSGVQATVIFNTEVEDQNGNFDPVTSIYTATEEGYYTFSAWVQWDNLTADPSASQAVVRLVKNFGLGSEENFIGHVMAPAVSETDPAFSVSAQVKLEVGDTVRIRALHTTPAGARNITDAWFTGLRIPPQSGAAGGAASGAELEGKTFLPIDPTLRSAGAIFSYAGGPITGDQSGTVDLSTAGSPRTIPANATHVVLQGIIADCNPTGLVSFALQVSPSAAALPDADYGMAFVNAASGGEGSLSSVGTIIIPIDPGNPVFNWYLDESLGGSYTALTSVLQINGYYITDTGSAANPIAFSARPTWPASQSIPPTSTEATITQVVCDVVDFNEGAGYSSGSNNFVAPIRGKYAFHARVSYSTVPASVGVTATLVKNLSPTAGLQGTEKWVGGSTAIATPSGASVVASAVSAVFDLEAGDTVGLYTQHAHGSPITLHSPGPGVDFEGSGVHFEGYIVNGPSEPVPLEGLTYLPLDSADRHIITGTQAGTASVVEDIDFSALGIAVPASATHAVVTLELDANGGSTPASDTHFGYAMPYTGAPSGTMAKQLSYVDNNTSENNTNTGTLVVPLNSPVDPTADLTVLINTTQNTAPSSALNYNIWVEGFYLEDAGITVDPPTYQSVEAAAVQFVSTGAAGPATPLFGTPLVVPPQARFLDISLSVHANDPSGGFDVEATSTSDFTVDLVAGTITGSGAGASGAAGQAALARNSHVMAPGDEMGGIPTAIPLLMSVVPTPGGTLQVTVGQTAGVANPGVISARATVRFRDH